MNKKLFILPALALALFAACSGDDELSNGANGQQTAKDDIPVAFDAYLNRTVSRAGNTGGMDLSTLQTSGFGVFAYYADGDIYSENAIPNFMYNQKVEWRNNAWEYWPMKYWPNEYGTTAISTGVDRVTFFAYAPYVMVQPETGLLTSYYGNSSTAALSTETGIINLTRNYKNGDPYVHYAAAFAPNDCVDLLYGVAAEDFTSTVGAADGANKISAGKPFINVAKPAVGAKLKFNFKHALAKLKVQVDTDVDIVEHMGDESIHDHTRVWIRSITFNGVAERGYLNMNSGVWYEVMGGNKMNHASVTIHDGRVNGSEPLSENTNETPIGFNPELIQSGVYTTMPGTNAAGAAIFTKVETPTKGVTVGYQNLFSGSNELLVIPSSEQLKITIVYDVETADPILPKLLSDGQTRGTTVENTITKSITLNGAPLKLESGKEYTLNLHLGLTSVKFEADVKNWVDGGEADPTWTSENEGNAINFSVGIDPYDNTSGSTINLDLTH